MCQREVTPGKDRRIERKFLNRVNKMVVNVVQTCTQTCSQYAHKPVKAILQSLVTKHQTDS